MLDTSQAIATAEHRRCASLKKQFTLCVDARRYVAVWGFMPSCPKTGVCRGNFPMLTSAMLRRLLIAIAALSISTFFATEGFAMAKTHAAAHSKLDTSASGGLVHG
jgi:hypothetical protein